jgi:cytochrome P450
MSSRVVVDFDHHSSEHAADPFGSFRELREQCPVAYSERHGGFWVVTGWEDVTEVGQDPASFSSALQPDGRRAIHVPSDVSRVARPPLEIDPPEFVGYRRLLEPHCTPKAIDAMEPGIRFWADYFIDRFIEQGEVDIVGAFATAVPSTVTIDWLGLPPEDWRLYWEVMDAMHHVTAGTAAFELADAGRAEMERRIESEILARRREPRPDLLSAIANDPVNGAPLPTDLAVGTALLLMAGGTGTTADLFAHAVVDLAGRRDVHAALLEDDRFMRTATEEYLRVSTPVLAIGRMAAADTELRGCPVAKGDSVLLAWGAANRDPEVFPDPDEIVLDRWPNRHLAFGVGPHRCVGSNLGRSLFKVMLRRFLDRVPDFRVVGTAPIANRHLFNSYASVELAFTPGAPVLAGRAAAPQFQGE